MPVLMALVDTYLYDCETEVTAYEFECIENFLKLMVACFGFWTFGVHFCPSNNGWRFLYTWTGGADLYSARGV